MRAIVLLLAILSMCCGCTHLRLGRQTVKQGSTLTDIQYQQVLDNLAMFACEPNALAWHVKVTGGVVQVADQGNAGIVPSQVNRPLLAPNLGLTRNVLGQWNVDPVVESDDLDLLQLAYQKALDPADLDRKIKKEVFEKICELTATYHIVLSKPVADEMIETLKQDAPPKEAAKLDEIKLRLAALYHRLDAQLSNDGDAAAASDESLKQVAIETASVKKEIVKLTSSVCNDPFVDGYTLERTPHGSAVVEQAEDKLKALFDLVTDSGREPNPFSTPWVSFGCKCDVPPCVCYVGHFHGCEGDRYAWVTPDKAKVLRDFVLTILNLVPPEAQEFTLPKLGVGAAFAPTF